MRKAKPSQLFIAADGPRKHINKESDMCNATRSLSLAGINWSCKVETLFRAENLGCQQAVGEAIDWFFSQVEEGIILEDDTLPDESFFSYCSTMLERYREDERVMHVSGNNYQGGRLRGDGAYYASQFAHSWGWATWARAWKKYDRAMTGFPDDWESLTSELGFSPERSAWWKQSLQATLDGKINTWDFQWHYTIMRERGMCLLPQVNLVRNIGVGWQATHTVKHTNTTRTKAGKLSRFDEPSTLKIELDWDEYDFRHSLLNQNIPRRSLEQWIAYRSFKKSCCR